MEIKFSEPDVRDTLVEMLPGKFEEVINFFVYEVYEILEGCDASIYDMFMIADVIEKDNQLCIYVGVDPECWVCATHPPKDLFQYFDELQHLCYYVSKI